MLPVLLIFTGLGAVAARAQQDASAKQAAACYRRGVHDALTSVRALYDAAQIVDEDGLVLDSNGSVASVRDLRAPTRRATGTALAMLEERATQIANAKGMGAVPPVTTEVAVDLVREEAKRPSRRDWWTIRDAAAAQGATKEQIAELRAHWKRQKGEARIDAAAVVEARYNRQMAANRIIAWIETRLDRLSRRRNARVRAQVAAFRERLAMFKGQGAPDDDLGDLAREVQAYSRRLRRRRSALRRAGKRVGGVVRGAVSLPGKILKAPFRKRRRRKPRRPVPRVRYNSTANRAR